VSQVYVVTGGGRGIGRALVERLARDAVVVAVERDRDALAWASEPRLQGRVIPVFGDAADENVAGRAADRAQSAGPLVGWVNNAAVFRDASVHSAPTREVLDLIAVNLNAAVVGSATAVRRLLAAGRPGAIVNVSSHQARQAVPGCTPYVTAKAAIEGLTRALAVEYGPHGIRVNAVAPGFVMTPLQERTSTPEQRQAVAAHIPMGRGGVPEDLVGAYLFLASDAMSGWITGATIDVNGGAYFG
jgi:NAD(P)-dependent dehydrogenase (short-subunit alcohol dehydrogenase family)